MKPLSPTPWRSIEDRSEVNFTHTVVDSDRRRLARIYRLSRVFGQQRDEAANSLLMAAAPELYESLKSCVATLLAQGITGPKVTEAVVLLERLRAQLEDPA